MRFMFSLSVPSSCQSVWNCLYSNTKDKVNYIPGLHQQRLPEKSLTVQGKKDQKWKKILKHYTCYTESCITVTITKRYPLLRCDFENEWCRTMSHFMVVSKKKSRWNFNGLMPKTYLYSVVCLYQDLLIKSYNKYHLFMISMAPEYSISINLGLEVWCLYSQRYTKPSFVKHVH